MTPENVEAMIKLIRVGTIIGMIDIVLFASLHFAIMILIIIVVILALNLAGRYFRHQLNS